MEEAIRERSNRMKRKKEPEDSASLPSLRLNGSFNSEAWVAGNLNLCGTSCWGEGVVGCVELTEVLHSKQHVSRTWRVQKLAEKKIKSTISYFYIFQKYDIVLLQFLKSTISYFYKVRYRTFWVSSKYDIVLLQFLLKYDIVLWSFLKVRYRTFEEPGFMSKNRGSNLKGKRRGPSYRENVGKKKLYVHATWPSACIHKSTWQDARFVLLWLHFFNHKQDHQSVYAEVASGLSFTISYFSLIFRFVSVLSISFQSGVFLFLLLFFHFGIHYLLNSNITRLLWLLFLLLLLLLLLLVLLLVLFLLLLLTTTTLLRLYSSFTPFIISLLLRYRILFFFSIRFRLIRCFSVVLVCRY